MLDTEVSLIEDAATPSIELETPPLVDVSVGDVTTQPLDGTLPVLDEEVLEPGTEAPVTEAEGEPGAEEQTPTDAETATGAQDSSGSGTDAPTTTEGTNATRDNDAETDVEADLENISADSDEATAPWNWARVPPDR